MELKIKVHKFFSCEKELKTEPPFADEKRDRGIYYLCQNDTKALGEARNHLPEAEATFKKAQGMKDAEDIKIQWSIELRGEKLFVVYSLVP